MKNKILIAVVFVIVMLLINPAVSAISITPNRKITTITNNEKEEPSKEGNPLSIGMATINVYVEYPNGKPCPDAFVDTIPWFGAVVIPYLMLLFIVIPFIIIPKGIFYSLFPTFRQYTDENGMCTLIRPAPTNNGGNIFRYYVGAGKGDYYGSEWTGCVEPGENEVWITLEYPEE